jgi:hypothetical protein
VEVCEATGIYNFTLAFYGSETSVSRLAGRTKIEDVSKEGVDNIWN